MDIHDNELILRALQATEEVQKVAKSRDDWKMMGYVGAALVTSKQHIYTGVNIQLLCGMGICAEFSAVAEMIKNGETKIKTIVASTAEGSILPPCGRCREMLYQINKLNLETEVIIGTNEKTLLRQLLPYNWQDNFDKSLY